MSGKKVVSIVVIWLAAAAATLRADSPSGAQPSTTRPAVTLINMHMEQELPEDIFTELGKQAGVRFSSSPNVWQGTAQNLVDVDFKAKPFWQALKELSRLTGVSPMVRGQAPNGATEIVLQHEQPTNGVGWGDAPVSEQNPSVFVQATAFSRQQRITYLSGMGMSYEHCDLELSAYIDPALPVLSCDRVAPPELALDDAGNSMLPDKIEKTFFYGSKEQSLVQAVNVPLKFPIQPGRKIVDLKATLTLRVGDKMGALSVDNPLQAAETSMDFDDLTIAFRSARKRGSRYEVTVGMSQDKGATNQMSFLQIAQLLDGSGRPFQFGGFGGVVGHGDMLDFTIYYMSSGTPGSTEATGLPAKWMIGLPVGTRTMKVPVEFKDLPLP